MSSDSDEEEEKNVNQRKDDKGKGQSSRGPRKTQSFKRSEVTKLMEVVGDDNKPNDVLTTSHCRMLREIQM